MESDESEVFRDKPEVFIPFPSDLTFADKARRPHEKSVTQGSSYASSQYRPAIDGLRAIAILSVFVFHLKNEWLPGGFVGVDVFFVISGYLITSILVRECERQSFSLVKFYQRRIARLFPAFFTVAMATLIGAFFVYSPQDLASSGANLTAAALSVANMKFILQGNYFAISPDAQPFLHYWSLSVEEQFYLLFPITFLFLYVKANRYRTVILTVFCAASLLSCIVLTHTKPVWAFYLLPARAWELLAGCILANFCARRSPSHREFWDWLSLAGLVLIVVSLFAIHEGETFPGYVAILPVLGTVWFLGPNNRSSGPAERLLTWKPMVLIGRMSYSLYLWHWPIFSLIDYKFYQASPLVRMGLKVSLSLALATLCFLLIETRGRVFLNEPERRRMAFGFLACCLLVFVPLGIAVRKANYINAESRDVAYGGLAFNQASTKASIVLMGDSNGSMYGKVVKQIADELGFKLNVISAAGEDPLPRSSGQSPSLWIDSLAVVKREKPDFLLLVCDWESKLQEDKTRLTIAVEELKQDIGFLIMVTQPPRLPSRASRESMRHGIRPPFVEDHTERALRMQANAFVKSFQGDNVSVIDIDSHFETEDGEILFADTYGNQYFHDPEHLSGNGANLVKADILRIISRRQSNLMK